MNKVEYIVGFLKFQHQFLINGLLFGFFQHKKNAKICENVQETARLLGICFFSL